MQFPTLRRPDKGPEVMRLQELLNAKGAGLDSDGFFGRETEKSVRKARLQAGLGLDEIANPKLWEWLGARSGPLLHFSDLGSEVEYLQQRLNRVGGLLEIDGKFGQETVQAVQEAQKLAGQPATGIADNALWIWLETRPDPSPDLPIEAVAFIVTEEIGGRSFYDRHAAFPHFPGVKSGITIGIGYDLRFHDAADLERDWGGELSRDAIAKLKPHLGKKGSKAAVDALKSIRIPFVSAWRVFIADSLPKYVDKTRKAFPGFDGLPPLARGMLVSLVYNRGAGMDGDSRREMRAIRDHIAAGRNDRVADELESMTRLWPGNKGLIARRKKEAALWRKAFAQG